jgi:hypothetical protein
MIRFPAWRVALFNYIKHNRSEPYELGTHDCWIFVAGAIRAMVGVDIAAKHRGRYKSVKGALGVMKRSGAANMAELASKHLEERSSPAHAQIGDVLAIPTDDGFGYALGILVGERVLVLSPNGIDSRDRTEATRAFGV